MKLSPDTNLLKVLEQTKWNYGVKHQHWAKDRGLRIWE